ncbi:MAG: alpha-amylase family glycosyl hydrolase [Sellimonas intestinalis]
MLGTCDTLLRGTPYIYQGEELGMTNCRLYGYLSQYRDVESLNHFPDPAGQRRSTESDAYRILADSLQGQQPDANAVECKYECRIHVRGYKALDFGESELYKDQCRTADERG